MSQPSLKSALKRTRDGGSGNDVPKKNMARIAPGVKDPKPSLRRQNTRSERDGDSLSDSDPLDSSSNGQEGAIFNESSTTSNDHLALFPQDQVTDLSTSSDFQPNIDWSLTYSPSVSVLTPLNIPHFHNVYSGPCTVVIRQTKRLATNGINDDHQPEKTSNVDGDNDNNGTSDGDEDKTGNADGDDDKNSNSDGDDDKTGNADADQQDMASFSVPASHKTLNIIDATDTIPDECMDFPIVETVAGLKDLIILSFLKEELVDSSRIRLTFFQGRRPLGSTKPQGRKSDGLSLIDDDKTLGEIFGCESKDVLKAYVGVQILPPFKQI